MGSQKKRKGLGNLGVDVLLSTPVETAPVEQPVSRSPDLNYVSVDLIDRSPFQPRQNISAEGIQELADSIKSQGLIQPIVVRKMGDRYELIAGDRRWQAAQQAGLQEIPAVINR